MLSSLTTNVGIRYEALRKKIATVERWRFFSSNSNTKWRTVTYLTSTSWTCNIWILHKSTYNLGMSYVWHEAQPVIHTFLNIRYMLTVFYQVILPPGFVLNFKSEIREAGSGVTWKISWYQNPTGLKKLSWTPLQMINGVEDNRYLKLILNFREGNLYLLKFPKK